MLASLGSLCIHCLVGALLWLGASDSELNEVLLQPSSIIEASLIELQPGQQQLPPLEPASNTAPELQEPQTSQEKLKELELEQQAEKQRKQALKEQERQEQELKEKARQEKALKEKELKERERKEKELALQRQKEQEKQRQLKAQQDLEADLFAQALSEEQTYQQESQRQHNLISYQQYIHQRTRHYWSRPPSARNGMKVLLAVNLVPTGHVNSVNIIDSSGDDSFDRSALQAVYKASPYEKVTQLSSRDFENNFRNFKMLFHPKDLRF